jgi:hypothetical protein
VQESFKAYFDESGDGGHPLFCMAGYLMEKSAAARLDAGWIAVLQKYNLPYFRMSACANGAEPFDKLTMDQRIECEKEVIALIKAHTALGIAVTVDTRAFNRVMPERKFKEIGSPYSLCAKMCLTAVKSWAIQNNFSGKIAYVFEAGHKNQTEANGIMNRMFRVPQLRADYRYQSHTIIDKADACPLQAADLLAWQWFVDRKRQTSLSEKSLSPKPRRDLQALVLEGSNPVHHCMHYDEGMLRMIANIGYRNYFPQVYPWKR